MSLRISSVQAAWLAEIGVDAHWLGALGVQPAEARPRTTGAAATQTVSRPRQQPTDPAMVKAHTDEVRADEASTGEVSRNKASTGAARATAPVSPVARSGEAPAVVDASALADLAAVHQAILACQACDLHVHRTRAVPGDGQTQSPEYLIVGEMPGAEDDVSGQPFDGQAGALLQAMFASVRLPHADSVYLTSVLKCRPTGGRAVRRSEVEACLPYLHRQIELLRPRHILALGRVAAHALLGTRAALDDLRGHPHAYPLLDGSTIPVWVTHHPASLLVRPAQKAQAWVDLLALARAVSADA